MNPKLTFFLLLVLLPVAYAQIDPFTVAFIYQESRPAGVIFTPDRMRGANVYAEHWVLYPNYVDPTGSNGVATEIIPSSEASIRSEAEFFRAAPWGSGYRYVRTLSYDTTMLPGR